MWGIPNEDDHWERVREEWENPRRSRYEEPEPEYDSDWLFLHEELEEIEEENGCKISELCEDDLMEIVAKFWDIVPEAAQWHDDIGAIKFWYQVEPAYMW